MSDVKYLPPELWAAVLARFPVRTLLRLRCVCKSWLSIIDSSDFVSLHLSLLKRSPNRTRLLALTLELVRNPVISEESALYILHSNDNTFKKLKQSARILISGQIKVIGFAMGLMLIKRSRYHLELWNPSTRTFLTIPSPPINEGLEWSFWDFAFGFNPDFSDYRDVKVVGIHRALHSSEFVKLIDKLVIYSLGSGSWRTKKMCVELKYGLCMKSNPLFHNGALYWPASRDYRKNSMGLCLGFTATHLGLFHLGSEEFGFVELPGFHGRVTRFPFLLRESIAIWDVTPSRSCIWVMRKDGGWTKWYSRDGIPSCVHRFFARPPHCLELLLRPSDFHGFLFLEKTGKFLLRLDQHVTSYDIESHKIEDLTTSFGHKKVLFVAPYVESLLLHKKFDGCTNLGSPPKKHNVFLF